ncbi:hypothetical protein [Schnuerera sp. xch1]|uniref:hypothetical protein n=1 Tax=Schnuerera sp. xch1 TaxID=2874283 RepID=UPI001CC09A52|nr:hypothetical protein [Schnuerera sp. xch1]
MRKTRMMKNISRMYEGMQLDEEQVFRKAKLLLANYRDVVWASLKKVDNVREICEAYYSNDLAVALTYLHDFAPIERKEDFMEKISGVFETKWMIDLIDTAMLKVYEYHDNGKLYHEILSKSYVTAYPMVEGEMLEALGMERSNYYLKKKEAIKLFGIALWGYALPKFGQVFKGDIEEEFVINEFFY